MAAMQSTTPALAAALLTAHLLTTFHFSPPAHLYSLPRPPCMSPWLSHVTWPARSLSLRAPPQVRLAGASVTSHPTTFRPRFPGIGLGVASVLASHGASVCLNGLGDTSSIDAAITQVRKLSAPGAGVEYHPADLLQPDAIADMVVHAAEKLGSVDILVNNAGIQHVAPVADFPLDMWRRVLDLNLTAVFLGTQAVLPGMLASGYGRIINVASVHGVVGSAGKSAYVAAKHGVVGLTKVTALETAGQGVTANAICPGWVLTPLVQAQCEARAEALGVSVEEATQGLLAEKQPSGQFTTPEDLGELAAFLASPAAAQMTGTTQVMDGGWTAQ